MPGRVGAYRITGELGRGGIGTVYRAVDPAGRAVALKVLLRGGDPDTDARLLRESSFRVEHPNVVRTLGGGLASDGQPYLVLELLEGTTLREALVDASPSDVVAWITQAARGVDALHDAGLVHRDIKPENLFLTKEGVVKVLDLGIAAWTDERARVTATGAVMGTPAYLAPEQVRGSRALDPRIDVWALGVVLFEGLTGRSPFRREGPLATMLAVSVDPIPRVDDLAPRVHPKLARVVHHCLERLPALRLASAAQLVTALEETHVLEASVSDHEERARDASVERAMALLVAEHVVGSRDAIEAIVSAAGGETLWLPDGRVVGVFGASASVGDEAERAVRAARGVCRLTRSVAVALGRASVAGSHARGEAVREAGEVLARASEGIVCGARTAQLLRASHAIEESSPGVFRVEGEGRRATVLLPLLARDVELAQLRRARDEVVLGSQPNVTYVIGAPGTGKTRLAEAVRGLAAELDPPMTWREAHARTDVPVAGLFERALRGDDPPAALQRAEDATVRVDRAREAVVSQLASLASEGPLVFVLEDAQWADAQTLGLVEDLARRLADLPVWLVVTGRPELLERLREPPDRASIVEPAPLSARDAIAMARALGLPPPSLEVANALVAHTGGNPLFVEVILGAFGESLRSDTLTTAALPATIEFAVQARLDQLPRAARDVLVALALLARPADLGELLELGCDEAESALDLLVGRDLVVRTAAGPHGGRAHRVRSPVVAQVALAAASDAARRELHQRAALIAASRRRDDEELAHHLESAGAPVEAASAYLAAALGAMNGGDARKVVRCGRAALRCGLAIEDAFELHLARADAARWAGDTDEQSLALDHAARAAIDDRERARVASARGELDRRRGDLDGALRVLDDAMSLARASGDREVLVWAACRRAITCVSLARLDEASATLAALEDTSALSPATRGAIEDARGYVAGSRGDLGLRRASFARAAVLHTEAGDARRAAGAESNAADAASLLGLFDVAETGLRRALLLARRVENQLT
ncbi:MAG: protein kinase, partial [Deltaproteobacteria bacterium]|nr:protein kinase [Deltaproteobacteria bacterium]